MADVVVADMVCGRLGYGQFGLWPIGLWYKLKWHVLRCLIARDAIEHANSHALLLARLNGQICDGCRRPSVRCPSVVISRKLSKLLCYCGTLLGSWHH